MPRIHTLARRQGLLSLAKAASEIGISKFLLKSFVERGAFEAPVKIGKCFYFSDRYIAEARRRLSAGDLAGKETGTNINQRLDVKDAAKEVQMKLGQLALIMQQQASEIDLSNYRFWHVSTNALLDCLQGINPNLISKHLLAVGMKAMIDELPKIAFQDIDKRMPCEDEKGDDTRFQQQQHTQQEPELQTH